MPHIMENVWKREFTLEIPFYIYDGFVNLVLRRLEYTEVYVCFFRVAYSIVVNKRCKDW